MIDQNNMNHERELIDLLSQNCIYPLDIAAEQVVLDQPSANKMNRGS